jgi:hypothetical protein
MTLSVQSNPNFTISHSFIPGRTMTASSRARAIFPPTARRTSPVLSAQELRQIVRQMVD